MEASVSGRTSAKVFRELTSELEGCVLSSRPAVIRL